MSGNAALWNTLWGEWIIEELIRCGLKLFCISPGSRSTPLTVAAARHPEAKTILNKNAAATPHAIIFLLLSVANPAAIKPIMIALSAAITISIRICLLYTSDAADE